MTIAAGFVCQDGIVLGADTEMTLSRGGKTYERKIFEINANHGCYLTYSGDAYFVKELVGITQNETRHHPAHECLERVKQQYQSMLTGEETKEQDQRSWAELLVTIRTHGQSGYKAFLYHLHGNRMFPVEHYAALGVGDEFGQAMFAPIYRNDTRMMWNALALIEALRKVKRSVGGCGGDTDILCVNDNAFNPGTFWSPHLINQSEEDFELLEEAMKSIIWSFSTPITDEAFQELVVRASERLVKHRQTPNRFKLPSYL
jgi:20S proteasome alpha/beta subunit